MNRAEFIALASPPCHDCAEPLQRVETRWHQDEDGTWRLVAHMVCVNDHRVLVVPVDPADVPASDEVLDAGWNCELRGHKYWQSNGAPSARCVECGGSDG